MPYNTKQSQIVLRCLEQRPEEALTAAGIAETLRRAGCPVGLATIYRHLERLERAGRIHRVNTEEGAVYQFCIHGGGPHRDCFLLRCRQCGRMVHLDCSHLQALCRHLEAEHAFSIDPRQTVLTGRCALCSEKEDAYGTP